MRSSSLVVLMLFTVCIGAALAQDLSPEQKSVWAREQAYCTYLQNNDLEGYMSLWDDNFVGWPIHDPAPVTKNDIRQEVATEMKAGDKVTCNPVLQKVNVMGDVAMTFYVFEVTTTRKDGTSRTRQPRITHTWRKNGNEWKIIGGMSAVEQR